VKKWILLAVVLLVAGGALFVRYRINEARRFAEDDGVVELSAAAIRAGLCSDDPRRRLDALAQIEKLPRAERMAALLAALESPSAPTRLTAVIALGQDFAAAPEVVSGLRAAAREDPDIDVREAAFNALAASGDTAILELAVAVLSSTDAPLGAKVRAAALLDRLTGRERSADLAAAFSDAEGAADELSMEWDAWLGENLDRLTWDAGAGIFTGAR
jgi:HEAT repeat protein